MANVKTIRVSIEKIGRRLIIASDHGGYGQSDFEDNQICFHRSKGGALEVGRVIEIEFGGKRNIPDLPPMLTGVREIRIVEAGDRS